MAPAAPVSARLERLVNLTATLLDTRRPLTLEELAERLEPPYPHELVARRRAFERDKETLRDLGIPVVTEPVDPLGGEVGYRIRPDDYYLPALDLSPDERAALHVAVSAVRLGGTDAREGLRKLGGIEGSGAALVASLPTTEHVGELFDAVARRRRVEFGYRDVPRVLEPYGVVHRFGHWYVVGRDAGKDAPRAFRVDRMQGRPVCGPPGAFEPPAGIDPAEYLRADPLSYGDEPPVDAQVLVDPARSAWVVDQLGEAAVVERRPDGAVVVRLVVSNREAFRSWVLELLEYAEVLAPDELRADLVAWLVDLAGVQP